MGRDRNVDERIIRKYILKRQEVSKTESVDCGLAVAIRLTYLLTYLLTYSMEQGPS